MRACSLIILSYLDAGFEPRCARKDILTDCCYSLVLLLLLLLLLPKMCCSPLDPKTWCKNLDKVSPAR